MINNVMVVSGGQRRVSATHIQNIYSLYASCVYILLIVFNVQRVNCVDVSMMIYFFGITPGKLFLTTGLFTYNFF